MFYLHLSHSVVAIMLIEVLFHLWHQFWLNKNTSSNYSPSPPSLSYIKPSWAAEGIAGLWSLLQALAFSLGAIVNICSSLLSPEALTLKTLRFLKFQAGSCHLLNVFIRSLDRGVYHRFICIRSSTILRCLNPICI